MPAPATTVPLTSSSTPPDNKLKPLMEPPKFQSKEEQSRTMTHYNEIFNTPSLTMTAEEQNAAIRAALFANEDTLPKEKDLLDAIGKIPSLVEPRKEALLHVAAALIDVYSQDGCPVDCGPDWTPKHIEAAICRGVHPSADSKEALEALHAETDEKVKNRYSKVLRYGDIKAYTKS